jgi:hypothetical protein
MGQPKESSSWSARKGVLAPLVELACYLGLKSSRTDHSQRRAQAESGVI